MTDSELKEQMEFDEQNNARSVTDKDNGKRWYVLHTYSGHERRVEQSLRQYIEREKFTDKFGQILVPTEEVVEMRGGQKRTTERNFYPGYVFIHMEMSPESWQLVNSIPHVSSFIGGKTPTPISENEAQAIIDQVEAGVNNPRPKFYFAPGELVRVIDGPFEEFNGTVEDVNYEKSKLRVSVTIFGRSTPVELDFSQVTKN